MDVVLAVFDYDLSKMLQFGYVVCVIADGGRDIVVLAHAAPPISCAH